MRFLSEEVIACSFYLSQLFATWAPYTKQGGGYSQQSAAYPSPRQPVAQGVTPQVLEGSRSVEGLEEGARRGEITLSTCTHSMQVDADLKKIGGR